MHDMFYKVLVALNKQSVFASFFKLCNEQCFLEYFDKAEPNRLLIAIFTNSAPFKIFLHIALTVSWCLCICKAFQQQCLSVHVEGPHKDALLKLQCYVQPKINPVKTKWNTILNRNLTAWFQNKTKNKYCIRKLTKL